MFRRKQKVYGEIDDSRMTVNDFRRRFHSLFESYRPADYHIYPGLSEAVLKPKLDRHLEALFSFFVDDTNGDMLDNTIFGPYRESLQYLNIQRLNHQDMNRRLIARRVSDRADLARIRDARKEELKRLEKEYEEVSRKMAAVEEE